MGLEKIPQSGENYPTDEERTPDLEDYGDIFDAIAEFGEEGY